MATTALATAALALASANPRDALAQCAVAPGSVTCAASTATTDTTNTDAASANSSDRVQSFSTGGSISATVQNGVTISGAGLAITTNQAGAGISLTNSGLITAGLIPTSGGNAVVNLSTNSGAILFTGSGDVSGGYIGVAASTDNGNITISGTGNITGAKSRGIWVTQTAGGTGSILINRSGSIDDGSGAGILGGLGIVVQQGGSGGVQIVGIGPIRVMDTGILVTSFSNVLITPGGTITTASDYALGLGIRVNTFGAADITINSAYDIKTGSNNATLAAIRTTSVDGNILLNVTGGTIDAVRNGVIARTSGIGNVTVNMSGGQIGALTSLTGVGLTAAVDAANGGNINVTANKIFAATGIQALSSSTNGTVSVTANGTITAGAGSAIATTARSGLTTLNINNTLTNNGTSAVVSATSTGGNFIINNSSAGTLRSTAAAPESSVALRVTNNSGGNLTLNNAGTITGSIIVGQGANTFGNSGTWNIGAASNFGTGSTTIVNSGTINVIGSATISGNGVTINNAGTIALSSPTSVLAVTGNVTYQTAGTYRVAVNTSTASVTNITGSATLGGTVNAVFAAGTYLAKRYTILTTSAGHTGRFSGVTNANVPAGFVTSLSYDAKNAYLDLYMGVNEALTGRNQRAASQSMADYFNNGGTLPPGFARLTGLSGSQQQNGYSQVSGQTGPSNAQPTFNATGQFMSIIFDGSLRSAAFRGGALGFADEEDAYVDQRTKPLSPEAREAYAAVTPKDRIEAAFSEARWGVWSQMYGGVSRTSGDSGDGTSATNNRTWGVVTGADYRLAVDTRFGFAIGGGSTSYAIDSGLGSGRSDMIQLGAYGKHTVGPGYVAGVFSYAWQSNTTDRVVTVVGTDNLHADFRSNALAGRIETGWRYSTPLVGITPYTALQSTIYLLPSYGEAATQGSNQFALNFAAKQVTVTRGELGLRWDKAMVVNQGLLTFKARTAWAHDWSSDRSTIATFQTLGTSFTVLGAKPATDTALLSLGVEMQWHNGWSASASYEGEYSRNTVSNGAKGTLRYQW